MLLIGMTLSACGPAQEGTDRLQIVASFSILADVVRNVAGDAADVTTLVPLGAGPHGFTPAPQDLVTLSRADVVFIVGANFEETLLESIENADAAMNLTVVSECVEIQPFGDAHAAPDGAHAAEEIDNALCASHHAALADRRAAPSAHPPTLGMLYTLDCGAHEVCDPHVWTDPHNVMLWTLLIRDTLSTLDPAHAALYAANTDAYLDALDALIDTVAPRIATIPAENRKLVTNHLAYSYYAHRFGLAMVGAVIPAASTLAEPSAAQIAALIDAINAEDVPAVFADSTANPTLAQQVADATGVTFYTLYTGSLTDADGPAPTYIDYILYDTQIIVEALGGGVE